MEKVEQERAMRERIRQEETAKATAAAQAKIDAALAASKAEAREAKARANEQELIALRARLQAPAATADYPPPPSVVYAHAQPLHPSPQGIERASPRTPQRRPPPVYHDGRQSQQQPHFDYGAEYGYRGNQDRYQQ